MKGMLYTVRRTTLAIIDIEARACTMRRLRTKRVLHAQVRQTIVGAGHARCKAIILREVRREEVFISCTQMVDD